MNTRRHLGLAATIAIFALAAGVPAVAQDELEVTMEVIDDLEGIEEIVRMRGPDPDSRIVADEGADEDLFDEQYEEASRLARQGFGGEELAAQFDEAIEDDFEHDDRDEDMEETFEDERDDLEDGEDVDQDEFDEVMEEPMDEPMDEVM